MKKIVAKLRRKQTKQGPAGRITNDTVAEHRERVLSGGRKFKYPLQYTRHKLVINTIIISILAIIMIIGFGWWRLYPNQSTSEFMYRVTRVLPLPVADVDGTSVRYSDYLMKYRSAEHYLRNKEQANLAGEDGARQIEYIRQQSMEDAVADAYAMRLADEHGVSVGDAELEEFLREQRQSQDGEVSQRAYDAVIRDYYNWDADEYRHAMRTKLLRQKVAYAIDEVAREGADTVQQVLLADEDSPNLRKVVEDHTESLPGISYGVSGWVPRTNQDGGLTAEALKLEEGDVSDITRPLIGDGYYFIRLIDSNASQVNYEYIRIPLRAFSERLDRLYEEGKVTYRIDIPLRSSTESDVQSRQ